MTDCFDPAGLTAAAIPGQEVGYVRNRLGSIKFRVVAVAVLFTLASALASVTLSLRHFQESARQSLVQSAEFNLNLVAGLVNRDLDALSSLRDWCDTDSSVGAYISGSDRRVDVGVRAFTALNEQVRTNRAYPYLLRAVAVSQEYQRILQCGSGTTAGIPLNPYTVNRLERLESGLGTRQWAGVMVDPFTDVGGSHILYTCGPIHQGVGRGRPAVGTVFLMVSTAIVTDSITSYRLPEGCALWLTVGGESFALDGSLSPIEVPASSAPTRDATFNASTRVNQCTRADGAQFLSVSCPVGTSGLWLTQTISPQAVNASLQSLYGSQLLLLILCSILIGAAMLWVLRRSINRPILRLQSRMEAISQGDFSPDPSIEWDNELGDVGRGVNHLSHSVEELMERRLADEKARQDLEYQMLQSQINPHFLYNSLNSIKWMATIQNADGIAEMITSLAHLLKNASKGQQSLIPLWLELDLLRDYFVIQKYRYGGAITMSEDIQPGLDGALIPRFTLQPLLENAIFHGIEPKGGAGAVTLTARREGDVLELTMTDDGVGMEPEKAAALLSGEESGPVGLFKKIGLSNVHRRVQYEFGAEWGLSIQSEPGRFTCVTVRLPYREDGAEEKEEMS